MLLHFNSCSYKLLNECLKGTCATLQGSNLYYYFQKTFFCKNCRLKITTLKGSKGEIRLALPRTACSPPPPRQRPTCHQTRIAPSFIVTFPVSCGCKTLVTVAQMPSSSFGLWEMFCRFKAAFSLQRFSSKAGEPAVWRHCCPSLTGSPISNWKVIYEVTNTEPVLTLEKLIQQ